MERLTARLGNGIKIKGLPTWWGDTEQNGAHKQNSVVRLAAYEDSGLTPEEVAELAKIVRCKDCDYAVESEHEGCVVCCFHGHTVYQTDFCNNGKKKGE